MNFRAVLGLAVIAGELYGAGMIFAIRLHWGFAFLLLPAMVISYYTFKLGNKIIDDDHHSRA